MHSLPLFHRLAGTRVIVLGDGEAADAKRRLINRAGAIPCDEADDAARIAFVALDGPEAAAARLRARGLLVNVVDRPDLCDFTVPSVLDRDPVLIAIGTGGASAGLAKALRMRLEVILPGALGRLAVALGSARQAMRGRWQDAGERRRALDGALAPGGMLDPLRDDSAGRVDEWLAAGSSQADGLVEFAVASDDPDDLTLRQLRWLGSADLICHESGVDAAILKRARADAALLRIDAGAPAPQARGLTVLIRRG